MITNLEKEHVGLKMRYTAVTNQTSLVLLMSQTMQEQAQLSAALIQHSETLLKALKGYEDEGKTAKPDGGSVPKTP